MPAETERREHVSTREVDQSGIFFRGVGPEWDKVASGSRTGTRLKKRENAVSRMGAASLEAKVVLLDQASA